MDERELILYRHVGCPYCERVVRRLTTYDVPFQSRFVSPTHSERGYIKQISGSRTVPVLVDNRQGITMSESANISEFIETEYGDGTAEDVLAVDLPPTNHPSVGEEVPEITRPLVTATGWESISLSTAANDTPILLVFYPMDGTGAASYTWIELRERDLESDAVLGCSVSTPHQHQQFIQRHELPYRLYSDPSNSIAEAYGVVHDHGGMTGIAEPRPAVFVINTDMRVTFSWVAEEWPATPPFDAMEYALQSSS